MDTLHDDTHEPFHILHVTHLTLIEAKKCFEQALFRTKYTLYCQCTFSISFTFLRLKK
jgi:hypothetical protein